MAQLESGTGTGSKVTIGSTSKGMFVELYDASGNPLVIANRAAVTETAAGVLQSVKDYKLARTVRGSSIGSLQVGGEEALFLYDSYEGTVRNLNLWIETVTTMTSAQALATGLTLNSGAITTINTGALESSHRQFPVMARTGLIFRTRLRNTAVANQVAEFGFGDVSSATTATINNGAFFRQTSAGTFQAILSFNGTETASAALTAPATTDYAIYEVFLEDSRATFQVFSSAGVLVSATVMQVPATTARLFALTHISAFHRLYNIGSAPATGGQLIINQASVFLVDSRLQRPFPATQSGMGYNSLASPTAYTQLANYANSAAPASATLSNTAAGYTTLGGQYQFAAQATNETDFALFGWQNPAPYTFYCTGIRIGEMVNTVAAVAGTASVYFWGAAFNSSAVSLATAAPYSPMRIQIGMQAFAIAAAIGATVNGFDWRPGTPMAVQPGRFLHIIMKQLLGTATATEIFRGSVTVDGYFE